MITIIGILIALLLPAVQAAREAARQLQCKNNLKQLALGMLNFRADNGHFPSGGWGCCWVGDPDRGTGIEQPGGWLYSILPHMEQLALYQLGTDGDPNNWTATQLAGAAQRVQTPLAIMKCPTRRQAVLYPMGSTSYGLVGPHGSAPTPQCSRGDYASCAGDQAVSEEFAVTPPLLPPLRF